MESVLGGGGFSYNDDVLNATPDGEESIQKLVDEIKNRAKACITSRNLPEAVKLYSKAIDVISGAVVSKENDAVKAVLSYVKGFYRSAMALAALSRLKDAKDFLIKGLQVKEDKELRAQLEKIEKLLINGSKEQPQEEEEDDESTALSNCRGYKKTSDGRTTTFFNREIDETAKKLIGDIAPKPIQVGSAWNKAGTYEETILTPWASAYLKEQLEAISVQFSGGSVIVKALPEGKKKSKKAKDSKEKEKEGDNEESTEVVDTLT
eukprot:gene27484-36263_t